MIKPAETLIANLSRIRELNREFLMHAKSGNHEEAERCINEMNTIILYEVRSNQ